MNSNQWSGFFELIETGMKATAPMSTIPSYYCHLCGRQISGRYKSYQHKRWPSNLYLRVCAECVKTRPRCKICDIPMVNRPQNGVCQTCSEDLGFCLICNQPISGVLYEFDGVGPYCQNCCKEREPCNICAAPLTDQHWLLSDGRTVCVFCNASAILQKEQANILFEQMKSVVISTLGLRLNVPTGLALVDRIQLTKVIQSQSKDDPSKSDLESGLDAKLTLGLYVRKGLRRGLYIITGLPRLLFLQVAAHEFAHAWQGENCPLLKTPIYHEGFAEWVAYQVIGYYGYSKGQQRMLARNDVYGNGLRFYQEVFDKEGLPGVINNCREMD